MSIHIDSRVKKSLNKPVKEFIDSRVHKPEDSYVHKHVDSRVFQEDNLRGDEKKT